MTEENMQNISTILLDMYGVIIEESKGNFIPYTYEHFNEIEYERLTKQFRQEQLFTRAGNGEISSDMFLTLLGYENPQYHMTNYLLNYLTLDSAFITFAEKYYRSIDFVIVSGNVKCRKPDKQIFEIALEKINKKPSECIIVDNSVANLNVSKKIGICPILFNRDNVEYTGITVNTFEELADLLSNSLICKRNTLST